MRVAIVYKSLTGNTRQVAEAIAAALKAEELIFAGEPAEAVDADLYLIGSWTDKGNCAKEIAEFLDKLENKAIAIFGTAGFGGSEEYYNTLFERIKAQVPVTNRVLGHFFCQGKMPMSVRDRYVSMMQANPEDKKLEVSIQNFDEALSHPDENDLKAAADWAVEIVKAL